MKRLAAFALCLVVFMTVGAAADDEKPTRTKPAAEQERTGHCNSDACKTAKAAGKACCCDHAKIAKDGGDCAARTAGKPDVRPGAPTSKSSSQKSDPTKSSKG